MFTDANVIVVAQALVRPDEGISRTLEYFVRRIIGPEGELLYGIRVDMRNCEGELILRDETPALTGNIDEVYALAQAFAEGAVMPYALQEMVEECFCLETGQVEIW